MFEKIINENSINNLPSQLNYKMGDRLIARENFFICLKKEEKKWVIKKLEIY